MDNQRKRKSRQVTIAEVARAAGVSASTISNVLNGRTGMMTSETLERVTRVIQELDYRPSAIARSLATSRTATIGIVIAETATDLFTQSLKVIEPIAREAGYRILMMSARSNEDEKEAFKLLLEKQVEGMILLSLSEYRDDAHLADLKRLDVPAVLVNRSTEHPDFDQINWDDTGGVASVVKRLVAAGHRTIAHLNGPRNWGGGANRLQGYRLGLEQCDLPYREELVQPGDYTGSADAWRESTLKLLGLSPRPTAIVTASDLVAAVAISTIQRAGLRVPEDVAVTGVDDIFFCEYLNPTLTTISLSYREAGRQAIAMLLERISGARQKPLHLVLPCPLIVRESCGTLRVEPSPSH